MMYPIVIFGITILAFFGIMMFVIPKIGKILTDLGGPDAKLPIYTQILLGCRVLYAEELSFRWCWHCCCSIFIPTLYKNTRR